MPQAVTDLNFKDELHQVANVVERISAYLDEGFSIDPVKGYRWSTVQQCNSEIQGFEESLSFKIFMHEPFALLPIADAPEIDAGILEQRGEWLREHMRAGEYLGYRERNQLDDKALANWPWDAQ